MAKDGTRRGGSRVGAGKKPKALVDKLIEGRSPGKVIVMPDVGNLDTFDIPPASEFMKAKQQIGKELQAADIYNEVWKWLKDMGCERIINPQLVEQYAMSAARWIQCEECISDLGFLAQHPTTGNPIASPFVVMSQNYMKQINQTWYQVYQIVKENCSGKFTGKTPQENLMEQLLATKKSEYGNKKGG
jgi:predicted transcriptional regulator YdeE